MRNLLLAAAMSVTLGAATTTAQVAAPGTSLAEDQAATTPLGVVFTAPKAWALRRGERFVEVTAPEGNLSIAIVDVGPAVDAAAALEAGWKLYATAAPRPVKVLTPRAPRDGWEERRVADYETSPNDRRIITASAMRRGTAWTVMIADGAEQTFEKRGAAANLVFSSVRPGGYTRESFAGRTANPMTPERIAALRAFLETGMRELGVPGASFALTDRGRTLYAGGIGVREIGRTEPVDGDTEFMVASNTKGLSTLLLARLVDEGKLRWDQPVTQVYPGFRLGSAETTAKVLVRHLVCACTGLPRKDMQWLLNTSPSTPASDTFAQLAATEPTSGFGEVFQYNNLMASAAGYIGGHLLYPGMELGRAYDRAMREKIFSPLGMNATGFDSAAVMRGNWARPHAYDLDGRTVVSTSEGMRINESVMPYRPAGGAWSNANDMVRYVRFELNEGKLDDARQWVSRDNLLERRKPAISAGEDEFYGMGLEQNRHWGVTVVHHGGSLGGYKSDIMLVPDAGIGAVLLTNSDQGQALLAPFMRRLLEILYEGQPEAAAIVTATAARYKAEFAKERETLSFPADAAATASLAPAYVNAELGRITVDRSGPAPVFRFTSFNSPMASRRNQDGTISFVTVEPTVYGLPLVVADSGGKRQLIVRDGQHEYRFDETR
jgi:CubicO group peptidase (beta-lactamase class C family)